MYTDCANFYDVKIFLFHFSALIDVQGMVQYFKQKNVLLINQKIPLLQSPMVIGLVYIFFSPALFVWCTWTGPFFKQYFLQKHLLYLKFREFLYCNSQRLNEWFTGNGKWGNIFHTDKTVRLDVQFQELLSLQISPLFVIYHDLSTPTGHVQTVWNQTNVLLK